MRVIARKFLTRKRLSSLGRFAKKRRELTAGFAIVLVFILVAIFAEQLTPYSPTALSVETPFEPPSRAHPFGTDNFGRDILSRVIYGARPDLTISVIAVVISIVVGVPVGILSGYRGKRSDMVIMAVVTPSSRSRMDSAERRSDATQSRSTSLPAFSSRRAALPNRTTASVLPRSDRRRSRT